MKIIEPNIVHGRYVYEGQHVGALVRGGWEATGSSASAPVGADARMKAANVDCLIRSAAIQSYVFPGPYQPWPDQRDAIDMIVHARNVFDFSKPGAGKTGTAVWAAGFLLEKGLIDVVVVLTTKTAKRTVWAPHFHALAPGVPVMAVDAPYSEESFPYVAKAIILGHDTTRTAENLIQQYIVGRRALFVVDEATEYNKIYSGRASALIRLMKGQRRIIITGTPAVDVDGVYGTAVLGGVLPPRQLEAFRQKHSHQISTFKRVPVFGFEEVAGNLLAPSIRREKATTLTSSVRTVTCSLTKEQKDIYDQMKAKGMAALTKNGADARMVAYTRAQLALRLLQVAQGIVSTGKNAVTLIRPSGRLDALDAELKPHLARGGKALVLCGFIPSMQELTKHIGTYANVALMNGSTTEAQRKKIVDNYQTGELQVIVAHPRVMAYAVTLTAGNLTIWFGPTTPVLWQQANERMNRPGQTMHVEIVKIVACPADRKAYAALEAGQAFTEDVLKAGTLEDG